MTIRTAALADVHGNLPALEAVVADARAQGVDRFIIAGDLVAGGPQPAETMRLLQSLDARIIRGNTDNYVLALDDGRASAGMRTAAQWALTRWSHRHTPAAALDFIAALPEECVVDLPGAAAFLVVHGAPGSVSRILFPDRDPAKMAILQRNMQLSPDATSPSLAAELATIAEPVLLCGHSHVSWQQTVDGKLAVNPGAVDGNLEGDALAHYALLTWRDGGWQVELRGVPYDLARSRAAFRESGLLDEGGALARAFLLSGETGENVGYFLVLYAYRLAAEAGFPACDVVPDDIWEQAAATFDWTRWEQLARERA